MEEGRYDEKHKRSHHVAWWPAYKESGKREKQPVYLSGNNTLVSTEAESSSLGGYDEFVRAALDLRADVLVARLSSFPWTREAIADEKCTVSTDRQGAVCSLSIRRGSQGTVTVVSSRAWRVESPTRETLSVIKDTGDYAGVGPHATPGALGLRLMRDAYWSDGNKKRQSRPPARAVLDLTNHAIGGRVDTPALGEQFDRVWELDRRNAYASSATFSLPIGSTAWIPPLAVPEGRHSYGRYAVYVPTGLPFSPLVYRLAGGMLAHCNSNGWYGDGLECLWFWREEVEAAEALGCLCLWRGGWTWEASAPVLRSWALGMHELRKRAPDDHGYSILPIDGRQRGTVTSLAETVYPIREAIKAATVAAIGRHGMHPYRYSLVDERQAHADARPYCDNRGLTDYSINEDADFSSGQMVHWSSYIIAMNRLELWRRALDEHNTGNRVLATNYDAIVLREPSALALNPDDLGGWRQQEFTDVSIEQPRWFRSREKVRTPGVSR